MSKTIYKLGLKKEIKENGILGVTELKFINEYKDQVLSFNSEADFQSFLIETKTSADDYSDVEGGGGSGSSQLESGTNIEILDNKVSTTSGVKFGRISINDKGSNIINFEGEDGDYQAGFGREALNLKDRTGSTNIRADGISTRNVISDKFLTNIESFSKLSNVGQTINSLISKTDNTNTNVKENKDINIAQQATIDNLSNSVITNTDDIKTTQQTLESIVARDKNQPVVKGEWSSSSIYDKNDIVFSIALGKTYISLQNNNQATLTDKAFWFEQNSASVDVNLDNYYTIPQTDNKLAGKQKLMTFSAGLTYTKESDLSLSVSVSDKLDGAVASALENKNNIVVLDKKIDDAVSGSTDVAKLSRQNIFKRLNIFGAGEKNTTIDSEGVIVRDGGEEIFNAGNYHLMYKGKNIPEQILNLENQQETNQIKFDSISQNLTEHEKLILTNQVAIKVNEKNINELVLENKKQINFLGSYDSTFNYMKNDSVVSKDNYYISLIDNNKQPLNDKNSWFSGAPTIDIDLSKYYTIIEINDMLKPLEQRLVVNESGVKVNTENIKNNDIYYENQFSDITGNIAIIDKKVEINMSNIVKKQNKLVAGKNIIIDETTNTISTNGDSDIWENIPINPVATGFNIPTINNYKKIKIQSKSNINLYTTIETDYMASWVAPNTLILGVENFISIPLTTNENSQFYVGGYINLSIAATGDAFFYVRYLKNGAFAITGTTRWTGEIIVKGVKK